MYNIKWLKIKKSCNILTFEMGSSEQCLQRAGSSRMVCLGPGRLTPPRLLLRPFFPLIAGRRLSSIRKLMSISNSLWIISFIMRFSNYFLILYLFIYLLLLTYDFQGLMLVRGETFSFNKRKEKIFFEKIVIYCELFTRSLIVSRASFF